MEGNCEYMIKILRDDFISMTKRVMAPYILLLITGVYLRMWEQGKILHGMGEWPVVFGIALIFCMILLLIGRLFTEYRVGYNAWKEGKISYDAKKFYISRVLVTIAWICICLMTLILLMEQDITIEFDEKKGISFSGFDFFSEFYSYYWLRVALAIFRITVIGMLMISVANKTRDNGIFIAIILTIVINQFPQYFESLYLYSDFKLSYPIIMAFNIIYIGINICLIIAFTIANIKILEEVRINNMNQNVL